MTVGDASEPERVLVDPATAPEEVASVCTATTAGDLAVGTVNEIGSVQIPSSAAAIYGSGNHSVDGRSVASLPLGVVS